MNLSCPSKYTSPETAVRLPPEREVAALVWGPGTGAESQTLLSYGGRVGGEGGGGLLPPTRSRAISGFVAARRPVLPPCNLHSATR